MGYWDDRSLRTSAALRGRPLRYVLTHLLKQSDRSMTVQELVEGCEAVGVEFDGRASKLVSDALRWEQRWGRVMRMARRVYSFGEAPRSTMCRIRKRVGEYLELLAQLRGDHEERAVRKANRSEPEYWQNPFETQSRALEIHLASRPSLE